MRASARWFAAVGLPRVSASRVSAGWVPSVAGVRQRCPAVAPHPALPRSLRQCPALPWGLRWTRRRPCDCPLPLVKTRPSRRLRGWRPRAGVRPSGPGCPASGSSVRRPRGCAPTRRGRPCSCGRSRASGRHSIAGLSQGCRSRAATGSARPGGVRWWVQPPATGTRPGTRTSPSAFAPSCATGPASAAGGWVGTNRLDAAPRTPAAGAAAYPRMVGHGHEAGAGAAAHHRR
jgi:hypothetical protein